MNSKQPPPASDIIEFTGSFELLPRDSHWSMVLVCQGNGNFYRDSVIFDFGYADCFLLSEPEKLSFIGTPGVSCRLARLSFALYDIPLHNSAESGGALAEHFFQTFGSFLQVTLPEESLDIILSYLKLCSRMQQDFLPISLMVYRNTLLAMLLYLSRICSIIKPEKRQEPREFSSREILVEQVKYLIHQNYSESLSLSYIADYVFANPSYLSRIFKERTGMCLSAYLNQVRIKNAKCLLEDTDELIIDIAVSCGFNYIPHFNRIFKEHTGMSPSAFRKKYRHHSI